jgi:hypothetical protein
MWKNLYIQLFALAIAFLVEIIIENDLFYSLGGLIAAFVIPIGMMAMISYLGFYKYWKEYNRIEDALDKKS